METGEAARVSDSGSFPGGKVCHACDLSQLNLGLGVMGVQVRVCGDSEDGEVSSEGMHGWLPGGGGWCPTGREGATTVL